MNKFITKIAALSVGLAMAIGVGVAVGGRETVKAHATTTTDEITLDDLGVGGSYASFSVAKTATYIGNAMAAASPNTGYMQFNNNGTPKNRCIATSVSGGYIRSVKVTYGNANSKTMTVYVSNSAYSLSNAFNTGTSVGTLSTSNDTVDITGDYSYVALFPSGATYPSKLEFTWESSGSAPVFDHYELTGTLSGSSITNEWDYSELDLKAYDTNDNEMTISGAITYSAAVTPSNWTSGTVSVTAKVGGETAITESLTVTGVTDYAILTKTSFDAISGDLLTDKVSFAATQGDAGTAPAVYSNAIRVYQNGGIFTVTNEDEDYVISSITIGSSSATTVKYSIDGGTEVTNQSIAANATLEVEKAIHDDIVFTVTDSSNRLNVNYLSVKYESFTLTNPITNISALTFSSDSVAVNTTTPITLTATCTLSDPSSETDDLITWTSSDETVATIAGSSTYNVANISLVATGTCTFTATTINSVTLTSATFTVTAAVEPAALEVTLSELLANSDGNYKTKFSVTGLVAWHGSNTAPSNYGGFDLVDENDSSISIYVYGSTFTSGRLTFNSSTATYSYSSQSDFDTSSINVGDRVTLTCVRADYNTTKEIVGFISAHTAEELTSITVTNTHVGEYNLNQSVSSSDFTVQATYAVKGKVAVASDDENITISPSKFTQAGEDIEVTITYVDPDGYGSASDTYEVDVVAADVHVTSITVTDDDLDVMVGKTVAIDASLNEGATYNLTFTIDTENSDEGVVSVNASGVVTGLAKGAAIILVGTDDAQYAGDPVEVYVEVWNDVKYSISDEINLALTGVTATAYASGNFSNKTATSKAVYAGNCIKNTAYTGTYTESIQFNASAGLITTASGGIAKSIQVEFGMDGSKSGANGKTLTVYGSNSAYEALGNPGTNVVTSFTDSATNSVTTNTYPYLYFKASGAMYINKIIITYEAQATKAELDNVDAFLKDSLKMDSYDKGASHGSTGGNGSCTTYYLPAKQAFNDLGTVEQILFRTTNEYLAGRTRYEDWAIANNDAGPYDGYDEIHTHIRASAVILVNNNETTNVLTAIIVIASFTLLGVGGYFFIRKKKEQ